MPILKKLEKERRDRIVPVKLTKTEYIELGQRAREYTGGNLSEWIRYAALNLLPYEDDVNMDRGTAWVD
jgi:hypothetical protein